MKKNKKVLVAMSGGVDSSVAALLLKKKGYQVSGIFMQFWHSKDEENNASTKKAYLDAKLVAKNLGIKLFKLNLKTEFKKEVVNYFLDSYQVGLTPNPCVVCNKKVKLGALINYANLNNFDFVASGHYLKLIKRNKEIFVYRAKDKSKDQSYFLYTLTNQQLKKILFPLANYLKKEVREIAKEHNLITASKAESQDICFLNGPHNNFLKKYLKFKKGEIREIETKKLLGFHDGLALYTIGQRRGINIGGTGPYYVAKLDYAKNILWVVNTWNHDFLYKSAFIIKNINFINKVKPKIPFKTQVVIRYGHLPINCLVKKDENKDKLIVTLKEKTRAITPGQSAVFYENNMVIGGGVIDKYI